MEDARVQEAVRLIRSGMDGVQAAARLNVPWPTLSSALRERGLSVAQMKAARDKANVSALADAGLTTEAITQRLGLPRRFVTNLCAELGLEVENEQTRSRRLKRQQVLDMHRGGVASKAIAGHLELHLGLVYRYIREYEDAIPSKVKRLYDSGLPLRIVAMRLGLRIDEARAQLRQSHPDAVDREAMAPETQAKLGASISAAWTARKAAAG